MAKDHIQQRRRRRPATKQTQTSTLSTERLSSTLQDIARSLDSVHATCVTVGVALHSQSADYDAEMGHCLRMNVAEPLSRQVEALRLLAQDLLLERGSQPAGTRC